MISIQYRGLPSPLAPNLSCHEAGSFLIGVLVLELAMDVIYDLVPKAFHESHELLID